MTAKGAPSSTTSRACQPGLAQSICDKAGVKPNKPPRPPRGEEIERLHKALGEVKVMAPPGDVRRAHRRRAHRGGAQAPLPGARSSSPRRARPPSTEAIPSSSSAGSPTAAICRSTSRPRCMRFANRVPLQYQPKACAISEAVYELNWKNYGLSQPRGSLPVAPMAIFVHLASVWVPFTSEAKEAVAHYPELLREITLALQECGRKLAAELRARARAESEAKRRSLFERYIPELGQSIGKITGKAPGDIEKAVLQRAAELRATSAEVAEAAAAKARWRGGASRRSAKAGKPRPTEGKAPATPQTQGREKRRRPGQRARRARKEEASSSALSHEASDDRRKRTRRRAPSEQKDARQDREARAEDGAAAKSAHRRTPLSRSRSARSPTSRSARRHQLIELGDKTQSREFFNVSMAKKFMQTFLVAGACKHHLLESGKTTSIRDLFYMTKHTIKGSQGEHLRRSGRERSDHRRSRGGARRPARGAASLRQQARQHGRPDGDRRHRRRDRSVAHGLGRVEHPEHQRGRRHRVQEERRRSTSSSSRRKPSGTA